MMRGGFAQFMEAASKAALVLGIAALCQPWWMNVYTRGFTLLVVGWLGLTIWSHRRPNRDVTGNSNPQWLVNGHPPVAVTTDALDAVPQDRA